MAMDFIKNKNFCSSKDITKKVKWKATYWMKIFATHMSEKELHSENILRAGTILYKRGCPNV